MNLSKGILIAIEGIDGSGKTTFAINLEKYLTNENIPTILTKEPGGTNSGQKIREILKSSSVLSQKTEFLLFAADRAQHFKEVIIPGLNEKKIIISDRLSDSSLVYQGYGRDLEIEKIKEINKWAMDNILPDLTIYVDIIVENALERLEKRKESSSLNGEAKDWLNFEKKLYLEKVIKGFQQIYKNRKDVIIIDGNKSIDEVAKEGIEKFQNWFKTKK